MHSPKAACLLGKTMNTATALWFLNGLHSGRSFKFTRSTYEKFGVSRFAVSKHLKDVEESGLIAVERSSDRAPIVMVIEEHLITTN
jgi:DNA-binding transcriptional ArsR family regulator